MTNQTILILGATSGIARATARVYAHQGWTVWLAARDSARLTPDLTDLTIRGDGQALAFECDVLQTDEHERFLASLPGVPDTVLCAVGLLGDQGQNEVDADAAALVLASNFTAPALLLGRIANLMQARGSGTIIGISSVAGNRGRASNYVYGSAKAGFTAFLSGLRNRLASRGVRVITVLPGFVATRMTTGMDLPAKLTAQPQEVAEAIFSAQQKKRDVIYVRPVWRLIMLIIAHIPEAIFKRLKL